MLSKVCYIVCSIFIFSLTLLLGLDVCGFAQFKAELQKIKLQLAFESDLCIDKSNILHIIELAYKKAFTEHNITAGWCKTGIHPFNSAVITPTMMAPAQRTSIVNTFPGATPYAVKKIHDWIHLMTSHTSHSSSPSSPTAATNSAANATTPTTPSHTIQLTSSSLPIPLLLVTTPQDRPLCETSTFLSHYTYVATKYMYFYYSKGCLKCCWARLSSQFYHRMDAAGLKWIVPDTMNLRAIQATKETWEYYSWTQYSSSSIPDKMPTKGQHKKDMEQVKLKQE